MLKQEEITQILEAALLASGEPISIDRMISLFETGQLPKDSSRQALRNALQEIESALEGHAYELKLVSSGYRFQIRQDFSVWVSRLWAERPPRYSRALMETLALIVYRQPVTRGDIEQVRGVSVSQNIMRTLLERGWIRVVGQREVPGRPSLYGTTRTFLDYFSLKNLDELPPMEEIKSIIEPILSEEIKDRDDKMQGEAEAEEHTTDRPLAEVVQLPTADR